MLKILPIASVLLAATTLWGQLEPVDVTVGETLRLKATARPQDSCAAQPGQSAALDLPSGVIVNEPGQRVEIQPRIVPGPGAAPPVCKADVVAIGDQKKAPEVLIEAEEPEAKPNQAKPAGGTGEGIKVHGHWIIDIRNPDGTLATHREFENSLTTAGATILVNSLGRTNVTGLWQVYLFGSPAPCLGGLRCTLIESSDTLFTPGVVFPVLTVSTPTTGLTLSGSFIAPQSGVVGQVASLVSYCASGTSPAACNFTATISPVSFTNANLPTNMIVAAGQSVQVTVVISFM